MDEENDFLDVEPGRVSLADSLSQLRRRDQVSQNQE
jgi:hypothetical protein